MNKSILLALLLVCGFTQSSQQESTHVVLEFKQNGIPYEIACQCYEIKRKKLLGEKITDKEKKIFNYYVESFYLHESKKSEKPKK